MADETTDLAGAEQTPTNTAISTPDQGANANPSSAGMPDQGGSSTTDTRSAQPQASSPVTPQPEAAPAPPTQQQVMDWEKQYRSVLPVYQKSQYELKRMREQYDGIDPNAAREAMQFREQHTKQLQLKPWQKDHPDHGKFQQTVQTGRILGSQIKAIQSNPTLSPEQKQAAIEAVEQGSGLQDSDRQSLRAWQEDMQGFQQKFHSDPMGTIGDIAKQVAMQVVQQQQVTQQADVEVGDWFQKNQPIVQRYGQQMQEVITAAERGETWQTAQQVAHLLAERDALREQLGENQSQVQHAAAQQQVIRGRATNPTRRNPVSTPIEDDPVTMSEGMSVAQAAQFFARRMQR
jgi:hypothetical protein